MVVARDDEQSRGFSFSSIQWPLSLYVISLGWKTDSVSLEGGEALLVLIRTEMCNHSNIHLSLQMKGEGPTASVLFSVFQFVTVHVMQLWIH